MYRAAPGLLCPSERAQTLREALKTKSVSLTHSESLELVATILGFHDWNVLSATIQSEVQPAANPGSTIPATVRLAGGMKILLVDDHALIRDALRGVLRELVEDAIVLEAPDSRQAMRLIEQNPDLNLILLDVAPDRDGFSALAQVRERYPAISIVVLSGQQDRASVVKALDLGALGFIPKSVQREVMRSALQLVMAGGIYIPPEIIALLRWHFANHDAVESGKACAIPIYGPHPEPSPALAAILRETDRMHARLTAERA